jgi:hypothetical protein
MGERRGAYRVLVGKPEGRIPLGRPRHRWEDNIKMDLREVGCGGHGLDQSGSGQGQVAGSCVYGDEPSGSIKCGSFLSSLGRFSFSGRTLLREVSKYIGEHCTEMIHTFTVLLHFK